MEREVSQLRSRDKRLGESLARIVDVLLQDETEAQDPSSLKKRKQAALESLSYVRDILIGDMSDVDEDRLMETESRKKKTVDLRRHPQEVVMASAAPRPASVPVVDSRPRVSRSPTHLTDSPSTSTIRSHGSGTTNLASWNHTRSSFSGLNPVLPVEGLPQPPSSSHSWESRHSRGQDREKPQQDPLGVLQ